MKQRSIGLIAILVVAVIGVVAGVVSHRRGSESVNRERMVEQFIAILPDSLDGDHILEIRQLFYTFSEREKLGKVKPETSVTIAEKLAAYVEKGRIAPNELIHFMAEVGYSTYKDEKKYTLEDSSVDHPVLNPEAGNVSIRFDSTDYDSAFWADFEKWKKENPELLDSLTQQQYTPPRRRP